MIRKIFFSLLLFLGIWGMTRFTHRQTDGLRLSKFAHNLPLTTLDFKESNEKILPLLQQKFTYFGRGLQSFSFLGEDGTTVLKLFNNRYQRRLWLARYLPNLYPFKRWKHVMNRKASFKLNAVFNSYLLASEHLRKETGLLYLHLQPGEGLPQIALVDKLKISHPFDLNPHAFALQHKAEQVYPYLLKLKEANKEKSAKDAVRNLVHLLRSKMQAGIGDRDPLIRTNFGFYQSSPMQIDIGPLYWDEALKNPARQREELEKITCSLKHWLASYYPELLETLDEAL